MKKRQNNSYMNKWILLVTLLSVVFVFVLYNADRSVFKSDNQLILGTWQINEDKCRFGDDGLDADIVKITFYSDGTCIISGKRKVRMGTWSIADSKLRLEGEITKGIIERNIIVTDYIVDFDSLTIKFYNDNYVYYKDS